MDTEVYIDLIFLTNFLMDYVLLRMVGMIFHRRKSRTRKLLASALGAFFSSLLIVLQIRDFFPLLLFHGATALLMIRIGLGLQKGSLLLRAFLTLYLTAFLCGGAWEVVSMGKSLTLRTFFLFTAGTFLILSTWNHLSDSFRARTKNIFPVDLIFQGRRISVYGYYDTGNLLEDPISHTPVSVMDSETLRRLIPAELLERLRNLTEEPGELKSTELMELRPGILPYHTIGSSDGLILTVMLDELCIHTPWEVVHVFGPLIALPTEPFALEKEYKVLLNAKLLSQEGKE